MLNHSVAVKLTTIEFFLLYFNLFIFYGPLWFFLIFIFFIIVQFFAEKKYPIGIFKPQTITYFLSFTMLVISFILYLNYDYYYSFLGGPEKSNYIRVLLINLTMVITGIIFAFYKKASRKWVQIVFLIILVGSMIHSFTYFTLNHQKILPVETQNDTFALKKLLPETFSPRKIRLVIMDGLSLKMIHSFASDQKLLNFNLLLNQGVSGKINTIKPNLTLSMLNTVLTGRRPAQFNRHSYNKFKITGMDHEFDVRPRYIFFRNSPYINTTGFYKRTENQLFDAIKGHYENNNRKCTEIVNPVGVDRYSERSLKSNNRFLPLFSDLLQKQEENDEKYTTLKKCFFLDDYLKNQIPNLKESDTYYTVVNLPGLGVISKYFYQFHLPQFFGSGNQEEIEIKKYGWLIEKYYVYYDSIIGNLMSTTGENELLVILSFFEYDPLPVWRRILVNLFGQKDVYVYKSIHSQGTILLFEKSALKADYSIKSLSIYDIYPTLLYYAGFQLSKDLQGEVLREIFTEDFLLNNPVDINPDSTDFKQ